MPYKDLAKARAARRASMRRWRARHRCLSTAEIEVRVRELGGLERPFDVELVSFDDPDVQQLLDRRIYAQRVAGQTSADPGPFTVWTYRRLRRRVRAYAHAILQIACVEYMDMEPLLPLLGRTSVEIWEHLRRFERRGARSGLSSRLSSDVTP